jgi:hypothetical protein
MPSHAPIPTHARRLRGTIDRRRLVSFAGATLAGTVTTRSVAAQGDASPGHGLLATPETPSGGPQSLLDLLALVPLQIREAGTDGGMVWQFADLATQLEALGIAQETGGEELPEGFLNAMHPLAVGSPAFNYALDAEFIAAIGFSPLETHRSLFAGGGTSRVSIFQGGMAMADLPSTWAESGYTELAAADGTTFWTLGDDGEIDFEHTIQRRVIANFNNAAILDDVLVYASERALLEVAIATWRGESSSLAEDSDIQPALAAMPGDTVSAVGLDPAGLGPIAFVLEDVAAEVEAAFDASDEAVGQMPAATGMVFGITEGFTVIPPDAATPVATPDVSAGEGLIVVRIATGSEEDAAQVARVVEYRWENWSSLATGEPFMELMPLQSATATGTVAELTFIDPRAPRVWFEIVVRGDVLPFLPRP